MEVTSHLTEKARKDYALVIRARDHGDQKAYAQLMSNHQEPLYYIMLKMTGNATDAEDLTIEAFGKAFKNIKNYSSDYAFSTWLYKIAANNCIDFLRKSKRLRFTDVGLPDADGSSEPFNVKSDLPDPETLVIEKQKIQLMREVVDRLKPHYRRLVELRYFHEWSYEEIANELDLPLGTVKAKLFRSREFLYQVLKSSQERI